MGDWSHIAPGVRALVRSLNERGYETTDSGDGTGADECALPYWHVFGVVPPGSDLLKFADELQGFYPQARVEVSYAPGEPPIFALLPPYREDA